MQVEVYMWGSEKMRKNTTYLYTGYDLVKRWKALQRKKLEARGRGDYNGS